MHWELQGDSLYVATPKGVNAIQVLTIHKAKGLEFPVVILPFLDDPIQGNHRAKVWLDTEEFFGKDIAKGWIPFTKRIETYGEQGKAMFDKVRQANELVKHWSLETMDNICFGQDYYLQKGDNSQPVDVAM